MAPYGGDLERFRHPPRRTTRLLFLGAVKNWDWVFHRGPRMEDTDKEHRIHARGHSHPWEQEALPLPFSRARKQRRGC